MPRRKKPTDHRDRRTTCVNSILSNPAANSPQCWWRRHTNSNPSTQRLPLSCSLQMHPLQCARCNMLCGTLWQPITSLWQSDTANHRMSYCTCVRPSVQRNPVFCGHSSRIWCEHSLVPFSGPPRMVGIQSADSDEENKITQHNCFSDKWNTVAEPSLRFLAPSEVNGVHQEG